MSTSKNKQLLDEALKKIPKKFRTRILDAYLSLKQRQLQSYYGDTADSAGLSAGKFCESVLRFLQYELTGDNIRFGKHISNFAGECEKIIRLPASTGNESLRVIIPRALIYIYTLRGKRGIGHVGGDVEANQIDLVATARICDWIICELIRIFHQLSLEEAQAIVDSVTSRVLPQIWEINGKKRVIDTNLSYKKKVLLLLYSETEQGVLVEDLFEWVEYSRKNNFKKDVLRPLHKDKLIEYDELAEIVYLSPTGIADVEETILDTRAS